MPSPTASFASPPAIWDIFCRVIDNHGDLGVCLRLGRDLATRGFAVRLWVDDASALDWMAPPALRPPQLSIHPWPQGEVRLDPPPAVVIEAFGCDLPDAVLTQMAALPQAPSWINLEYLSAECYVERSHGLPSPQFSGPGRGLSKHFFYPGFTQRTGGLLREPGLMNEQRQFSCQAWLSAQGIGARDDERLVSVFSYPGAPLEALMRALSDRPGHLLLCPGWAQQVAPAMLASLQAQGLARQLRLHALPYLLQSDYDRLLWACDLNLVRGEDSFVRAQWAAKPMLWHIYPQSDGAHEAKLEAFLDRQWQAMQDIVPAAFADAQRQAFRAWNGLPGAAPEAALARWITQWESLPEPTAPAAAWRDHLCLQEDLCTQLIRFVAQTQA